MSLLSPTIGRVRCLADEEADHNMLQDLQLAAELGKTLLERNKELENTIRSQQHTIEEQSHEIEYMKKQTAALREVNDSRLKIYEQLEVSIQDLERANHLLVVDNANEKKVIKSQALTIENLEIRYDELQKKFDDLKTKHQVLVKQQAANEETQVSNLWKVSPKDDSINQRAVSNPKKYTPEIDGNVQQHVTNDEERASLLKQLNDVRSQRAWEQKKVAELEVQLASLLHENAAMEEQLRLLQNKAEDVKNLQDELNTLEEVRNGHLCGRCLRGMNVRNHEELIGRNEDDIPEVDEMSLADSLRLKIPENSDSMQDTSNKFGLMDDILGDACNTFIGSYKGFMEDKSYSASRFKSTAPSACLSLQDELKMSGEFNTFQNTPSEPENHPEDKTSNGKLYRKTQKTGKKAFSGTPTDFSEAETLSSGFSDETSNKSTQTDGRPGYLLCSIADGDNCKLSIYDDNSTFESRFNQTPEIRETFAEIFSALKRTAEAKIEEEKLPQANSSEISNMSPNFPSMNDDIGSETTDDTQSVMSSTISSVVSEPVFRIHTPVFDRRDRHRPEGEKSTEPFLRPLQSYKRQQLDYLSIQTRKKSVKKSSPKKHNLEPPTTPDIIPTTNPKVMHAKSNSGGKRRFRPLTNAELDGGVWNGHTTHFYPSRNNRDRKSNISNNSTNSTSSYSRNSSDQSNSSFEYKDYKPSAASQEIAKLKRLDMSYAEVLRMPNKPKGSNMRRS